MSKLVFITGATDGIGLESCKKFASENYDLIIHGRSLKKIEFTKDLILKLYPNTKIDSVEADFSDMKQVKAMVDKILQKYDKLDILVNNAGIFVTNETKTIDNLELRFVVNTIAPYYIAKELTKIMDNSSRIINLSSAAQAPVDINNILKYQNISHDAAYAQSKLALTMWSIEMGLENKNNNGPIVIALNPKSFLGSKMVKTAYNTDGYDIRIGSDKIYDLAVLDEFRNASGMYYDNDIVAFSNPHPDAMDRNKRIGVVEAIEKLI